MNVTNDLFRKLKEKYQDKESRTQEEIIAFGYGLVAMVNESVEQQKEELKERIESNI
jgi:translation elongation factor EF-1beta